MKLGLTLPSFVEDPEIPLAVARSAEAAGLDGVFVFDHLFRRAADGSRRPALEGLTMLGAVAAETRRIAVGTLVARATLRPPATLAVALETVRRVSGGRLLATIGAGDEESKEENESFGLDFATIDDRVAALDATLAATAGHGYPVWVGGTAAPVRELAGRRADGWNRWGGTAERFARQATDVRRLAGDRVGFAVSWGGLVVVGATEAEAAVKANRLSPSADVVVGGPERVADSLRAYRDAGADWIIAGPIDSADPDNAHVLAELVRPLLVA